MKIRCPKCGVKRKLSGGFVHTSTCPEGRKAAAKKRGGAEDDGVLETADAVEALIDVARASSSVYSSPSYGESSSSCDSGSSGDSGSSDTGSSSSCGSSD